MAISSPNVVSSGKGTSAFLDAFQIGSQMIQFNQALKLEREKFVADKELKNKTVLAGVFNKLFDQDPTLRFALRDTLGDLGISVGDLDRMETGGLTFGEKVAEALSGAAFSDTPPSVPPDKQGVIDTEPLDVLIKSMREGGGASGTAEAGAAADGAAEAPVTPERPPKRDEVLQQAAEPVVPVTPVKPGAGTGTGTGPDEGVKGSTFEQLKPVSLEQTRQNPVILATYSPGATAEDISKYFTSQGVSPERAKRAGEKTIEARDSLARTQELFEGADAPGATNNPAFQKALAAELEKASKATADARALSGSSMPAKASEQRKWLQHKAATDKKWVEGMFSTIGDGNVSKGIQVALDFAATGEAATTRQARIAGQSAKDVAAMQLSAELFNAKVAQVAAEIGRQDLVDRVNQMGQVNDMMEATLKANAEIFAKRLDLLAPLMENMTTIIANAGGPEKAARSPDTLKLLELYAGIIGVGIDMVSGKRGSWPGWFGRVPVTPLDLEVTGTPAVPPPSEGSQPPRTPPSKDEVERILRSVTQ